MISIVRFYNSVMQTARAGSSGYVNKNEWNTGMSQVETDVFNIMAPLYSTNFQVQDILAPFVTSKKDAALVDGVLTKETDYSQFISAEINGNPVYPLNLNEVSIIKTSPVRKPSIEKNQYYLTFENDKVSFLPETITKVDYRYLRKPVPAELDMTVVSNEDSDYVTPVKVKDLEWPEKAFNILYYLMLEKYGVDQRESLAYEYAQLGIQKEISKV